MKKIKAWNSLSGPNKRTRKSRHSQVKYQNKVYSKFWKDQNAKPSLPYWHRQSHTWDKHDQVLRHVASREPYRSDGDAAK